MPNAPSYAHYVLKVMEQPDVGIDPKGAYNKAGQLLGRRQSIIEKGCPKNAFLGLCEDGYVKGVPNGHYTLSRKVKSYAVDAVKLLISNPGLERLNDDELWNEVEKVNVDARARQDGGQSETTVVRALWSNGFINK